MTDTDSVLYHAPKVTKYPLVSDGLEKEIHDKLLRDSGMPEYFDTHNFLKDSPYYSSKHKKHLLRFWL